MGMVVSTALRSRPTSRPGALAGALAGAAGGAAGGGCVHSTVVNILFIYLCIE